jgi:acetyl-CoA carboxylase / biotin carboxylase 1
VTTELCVLDEVGNAEMCFIDAYGTPNAFWTKRVTARRVGSSFSYDFLGLVEVCLLGERREHRKSFGDKAVSVPKNVCES